jgi:hypothetical protein
MFLEEGEMTVNKRANAQIERMILTVLLAMYCFPIN